MSVSDADAVAALLGAATDAASASHRRVPSHVVCHQCGTSGHVRSHCPASSLPGSSLKLWRPEPSARAGGAAGAAASSSRRRDDVTDREPRKRARHSERTDVPLSFDQLSNAEIFGNDNDNNDDDNDDKNDDERDDDEAGKLAKKELPDFRPSGKLAAAAMQLNGVTLKYVEPPSARMAPANRWRLYEFKGDEQLDTIKLQGKSVFRIGRDERVCDLTMLHHSVSSQHAAIQFREVVRKNRVDDKGAPIREIVPAIIDLKSTNGTRLNGNKIQDSIYIELKMQDVVQFGDSTREYVVIASDD